MYEITLIDNFVSYNAGTNAVNDMKKRLVPEIKKQYTDKGFSVLQENVVVLVKHSMNDYSKRDLDNYLKPIIDCLNNIVIKDDKQIDILVGVKTIGHLEYLDKSKVTIQIHSVDTFLENIEKVFFNFVNVEDIYKIKNLNPLIDDPAILRSKMSNARINALNSKKDSKNEQLDSLDMENNEILILTTKYKNDIKTIKDKLEEVTKNKDKYKAEVTKLNGVIKEKNDEIQKVKTELGQVKKEESGRVKQSTHQALQKEFKEYKEQFNQKKIDAIQKDIQKQVKDYITNNEAKIYKGYKTDTEYYDLMKEKNILEYKYNELSKKNVTLSVHEELVREHNTLKKEYINCEVAKSKLEDRIKTGRLIDYEIYQNLKKQYNELEENLSDYLNLPSNLTKSNYVTLKEHAKVVKELEEYKDMWNNLSSTKDDTLVDNSILKTKVKQLEKQLATIKNNNGDVAGIMSEVIEESKRSASLVNSVIDKLTQYLSDEDKEHFISNLTKEQRSILRVDVVVQNDTDNDEDKENELNDVDEINDKPFDPFAMFEMDEETKSDLMHGFIHMLYESCQNQE